MIENAKARLREGTEVLRTGGGVHLTAFQCRTLLDYINDLENRLGIAEDEDLIKIRRREALEELTRLGEEMEGGYR